MTWLLNWLFENLPATKALRAELAAAQRDVWIRDDVLEAKNKDIDVLDNEIMALRVANEQLQARAGHHQERAQDLQELYDMNEDNLNDCFSEVERLEENEDVLHIIIEDLQQELAMAEGALAALREAPPSYWRP